MQGISIKASKHSFAGEPRASRELTSFVQVTSEDVFRGSKAN